jgi:hypothetical protein
MYFYGDYCSGKLLRLVHNPDHSWTSSLLLSTGYSISSFGEDEQGELYIVDYGGRIFHMQGRPISSQTFTSDGVLDGTVTERKETSGTGGTAESASDTLLVGDTDLRQQQRAILSFDTSSLPDNASLVSATLRLRLSSISSPDPFGIFGPLIVSLATPRFGTAVDLQPLDFQAAPRIGNAGTIGPIPDAGWYSAVLKLGSLPVINRRGLTQFRLRFKRDDNNDSVPDSVAFFSGDAADAGSRPQLVVGYSVP